jgi:hypothetical protein
MQCRAVALQPTGVKSGSGVAPPPPPELPPELQATAAIKGVTTAANPFRCSMQTVLALIAMASLRA